MIDGQVLHPPRGPLGSPRTTREVPSTPVTHPRRPRTLQFPNRRWPLPGPGQKSWTPGVHSAEVLTLDTRGGVSHPNVVFRSLSLLPVPQGRGDRLYRVLEDDGSRGRPHLPGHSGPRGCHTCRGILGGASHLPGHSWRNAIPAGHSDDRCGPGGRFLTLQEEAPKVSHERCARVVEGPDEGPTWGTGRVPPVCVWRPGG